MDVNKLKFTINVDYNYDEGEGCNRFLDDGPYPEEWQAVSAARLKETWD